MHTKIECYVSDNKTPAIESDESSSSDDSDAEVNRNHDCFINNASNHLLCRALIIQIIWGCICWLGKLMQKQHIPNYLQC